MANRRRTAPSGGSRSRSGQSRASSVRAPRKKSIKIGPLPFIIVFAAAVIVGGIAMYNNIAPLYTDVIAPGVTINGMDVSGKTADEAFAKLTDYANQRIGGISVTINYNDQTWTYGASELNASLDFSEVVASAAAVARTGKLAQRKAEAQAALAGQYAFDTSMAVNSENLVYYLNQIKQQLDIAPVEPTMSFSCDGPNYTIVGHNYWEPGVDYSPLFTTTPGKSGLNVDVEATMEQLRADLADDYVANVNLVVHEIQPQNSEQSLRDSAVLLYHSSSKLRSSTDNRNINIGTALGNFDGMVIPPDAVISFNETVGERTKERGYMEAHQIGQDGSLEDELGGGICQAATTLFNAIVNAGCEIVSRNPHKWPLYYLDYDWGLDAMVNWGTSDMVFKNTTGGYLYLDFYFDYSYGKPSYVDIDIFGLPFEEGVTIEMESIKVSQEDAPPPRYELKGPAEALNYSPWVYDGNLNLMTYVKVTSRPGYVFRISRIWKKDGVEFKREELYTTSYPKIQGVTYTKAADNPAT